MKQIKLTQGRVAIVDDEDFEWLSKWKWCYNRVNNTGYAQRTAYSSQKRRKIYMHIAIMKRHKRWKRGKEIDHQNTCGCDNRKMNLRLATRKQTANAGLRLNNTSGVTGVTWDKSRNKWKAQIMVNGKCKFLSRHEDFDEAVKKRQQAEIKYFGEYRHDPTNVCPLGNTGKCPDCAQKLRELIDEIAKIP